MTRIRAAILLVPLLVIPACISKSTPSGTPKLRVAFVSNNPDPFWSICEAGCRKAETQMGVEVIFRKPASGDSSLQREIIDNLLSQDIKALSVSVSDPKNQTAYLDTVASKLPLIAVDNDAPNSKRRCYIGTNNYTAGRAVGALVKEAIPDGGVVAIFVGATESLNARQRRQGVLDELAGRPAPADLDGIGTTGDGEMHGKYKLLRTFTDQPVGQAKAKENAVDALAQVVNEPNVCFVGLWAYNPPSILSAVQDAQKIGKVKIVGFDENPITLKGIEDGAILGTVVQDPFNFGFEAVKLMAEYAQGHEPKVEAMRYVKHRVVTKAGGVDRVAVVPFREELNKNMGK